jgi:indoleamine 2,3-dioxygenase
MIPCMDNLLQITSKLPSNPLTEMLRDFRRYRPTNHKEFLDFVQRRAEEVNVRGFAVQVYTVIGCICAYLCNLK